MAVGLDLLNANSVANINTNFIRVQAAFQDSVSRSGNLPNHMNADLDMNSNDILNIATLQVQDITIDGTDSTGILERALDAVELAEDSANLAEQWATNPEDLPVEGGLYSSFHWAQKSEQIYEDVLLAASFNPIIKQFTTSGVGPYDMEEEIGAIANLDVKIGGVFQDHTKYTILGTTFTLTDDPGNGLEMEAIIRSGVRSVFSVPDDTINTNSIIDDAVTLAKLNDDVIDYIDTSVENGLIDLDDTIASFGYIKGVGNQLPTIALTFDYYVETSTTARTIMDSYGLVGTFYVDPSTVNQVGGPTQNDLASMKSSGWEIGLYTGSNWVTDEATNRIAFVQQMRDKVEAMRVFGLPVNSVAPNQRAWNIKLRNLSENFFTHARVVDNYRSVDGFWQPLPVEDRLWIKRGATPSLSTSDTGATLSAQVDDLINLGGLWTVVVHRVADSGDPNFRVTTAAFNTFCAKIAAEEAAGNLRVIRFHDL